MRGRTFWLFLWLTMGCAAVPEEDAEVVALRERIAQWVGLESRIVEERTAWQAEQASMAQLLELHRKEIGLLEDELEQAGGSAEAYAEQREALRGEISELKAVRDEVRAVVERLRPRWLGLALPPPLVEEIEAERAKLEGWQRHEDPRPALQAMLAMLGAAEQFHRRFTRATEVRDGRQVEVLYVGLTAAYFLDGAGGAGMGRPGVEGWTWEARPQLAEELRSVFDQLEKRRPPELVRLPLQIGAEGGGR